MVFYFFILIVFISEIIITLFVISKLLVLNNAILEFNKFLFKVKPDIREIGKLGNKISEQCIELANIAEEKLKSYVFDFFAKYIKGILTSLIVLQVKKMIHK